MHPTCATPSPVSTGSLSSPRTPASDPANGCLLLPRGTASSRSASSTLRLRNNRTQATAGRVLIEAARIKTPLELEQKLRRALADPTFTLCQWSDEVSSWVDGDGQTITLPPESKHQKVTILEAHGRPSTALIHGPAALKDPDVAEAVLAAVRFVVERQRLENESFGRTTKPTHLPTGFVTHLLTDVESSTELLTQLTDRYAAVLAKVRKIISQEIRRNGGYEVEVRADDSYAVFEDAADAVRAAVGFQRRLETTRWPDHAQVRVRVGIHSGEISLSDGGYVGLSLNTAARVMAAGHGGQILTTRATRDAISGEELDGTGDFTVSAPIASLDSPNPSNSCRSTPKDSGTTFRDLAVPPLDLDLRSSASNACRAHPPTHGRSVSCPTRTLWLSRSEGPSRLGQVRFGMDRRLR
jgi:class 3 adenylate cyclase